MCEVRRLSLNVLTNNLRPDDLMFVWLQHKANIILHILFYFGSLVDKMKSNL